VRVRLLIFLLAASALPGSAQEPAGWKFGPVGQLYPDYLADPRRPQMAAGLMFVLESDLDRLYDSGGERVDIKLGERIPVLRYTESDGQAWELAVEGAFFGQFDRTQSLENIGWDGWYGANIAWRFDPGWAVKLHYRHLSSHLGDEFIERTGRERIGYTREDLTLGLAWTKPTSTALYAEFGVDTHDGAERQRSLFGQLGAQYREPRRTVFGIFGWHLATDLQFYQEESYRPEFTLQGALLIPAGRSGQQGRIAVELHTGRTLIGELSELTEKSVTILLGWDF
jgi:hypothetical protein